MSDMQKELKYEQSTGILYDVMPVHLLTCLATLQLSLTT